jgi:glycosyltransferase involved in cell wall biosynthesis
VKPYFSIITPVYNRADLVGETIETVLKQEFQDFEYILVDDKSTDNSLEVLESYAKMDSRIKIVRHEINQGRCITRNTGINTAIGQWICFLDSDDFYHPNHLTVLKELISKFPNIQAFATEQTWDKKPKPYNNKRHLQDNVILTIKDFVSSNPISSNQLCYKSSLKTRWINERLPISEDWLYHRQLVLGTPILKTRTVTTDVRVHDGRSLDQTDVETFVKWNLYAANKFVELEKSNISNRLQNQILAFIHVLCANILLSQKKKKLGRQVFKMGLKYPPVLRYALFYKALIRLMM